MDWIVAATILTVGLGGCRDRSIGGEGDAHVADAGSCLVPVEPVVIVDSEGPNYVYGLDVLPDGLYLLGALVLDPVMEGRGGLFVLDRDTLEEVSFLDLPGGIYGRYDGYGDLILAARNEGSEGTVAWLRYYDGGGLEMLDATRLCYDCGVSSSLPAQGDPQGQTPLGLAVAVEHHGLSEVELFAVDRGVTGVARSIDRVPGRDPSVAAGRRGFLLTYTALNGHLTTRVVDDAGTLVETYEHDPVPAERPPSVSVSIAPDQADAVFMDTTGLPDGSPVFSALEISADGVAITQRWYEEVSQGAEGYWLSVTGDRLVVTWTDAWIHGDVVGVWLLLLTARHLNRVCGPVRVGEAMPGAIPRAVSTPHPDGLVVIWPGDGDNDRGLLGKIVSVAP